MSFIEQIGAQLLTKDGLKPTEEVLKGAKHVLAYFSAHWCPPCKAFTPALAGFYTQHKEALSFEVVFFSLDHDAAAFESYYNDMPWTAVPYEASTRNSFAAKHGGDGIPELVIFSPEGAVVTHKGVEMVTTDAKAENFPWAPPSWESCLGKTLLTHEGEVDSIEAMRGKTTIGVYCSASWCPPCTEFTPKLAEFYEEYKKVDPNFEIIFCSRDKSKAEMDAYYTEWHGKYLAIPYDCENRGLMMRYVDSDKIPTFAVYNADGTLLNKNGRAKVDGGVKHVEVEGWAPPLVADIKDGTESNGADINSAVAVLVRCEGCDDDEQSGILTALTEAAKATAVTADGTPETIFFISRTSSPIGDQLTALFKQEGSKRVQIPDSEPLLILLDIPQGGFFYESPPIEITADSVKEFVMQCKTGKATKLNLSR